MKKVLSVALSIAVAISMTGCKKGDFSELSLCIKQEGLAPGSIQVKILYEGLGNQELYLDGHRMEISENEEVIFSLTITGKQEEIRIRKLT